MSATNELANETRKADAEIVIPPRHDARIVTRRNHDLGVGLARFIRQFVRR